MGIGNRTPGNFRVITKKNEGIFGTLRVRILSVPGVPELPFEESPAGIATTSLLDIDFYFCFFTVYVNYFP